MGEHRASGRGFSCLLLMFSLALTGAALAALGSSWQQAGQRSREAELIFRETQIQDTLQRHHDSSPAGQPRLPESLEVLQSDLRDGSPRHHLRRLWADPSPASPTGCCCAMPLAALTASRVSATGCSPSPRCRRAAPPRGKLAHDKRPRQLTPAGARRQIRG